MISVQAKFEERIRLQQLEGGYASVSIQGSVLEYKHHFPYLTPLGGKRGEIGGFSRAARLRMLKDFAKIDFTLTSLPLFVTLTYPDECAYTTLDDRNTHRKLFARHLEKYLRQNCPAAWRIEWVERQSGFWSGCVLPHFHFLIFKVGYIPYDEINRAWRKAIGHDGYVRTDIRRVDAMGAVQLYMAKYVSKDAVSSSLVYAAYQNKIGRAYGWLRKREIPWAAEDRRERLTEAQRASMMGLAAERLPVVIEGLEQSFTLFGDVVQDAQKILDGIPLTGEGAKPYTTPQQMGGSGGHSS